MIFCDNQSVVEMINKMVSSCKNFIVLNRLITFTSIKHNVRFFAKYVRITNNIRAAVVSRLQFDKFWGHTKETTEPFPTHLPDRI